MVGGQNPFSASLSSVEIAVWADLFLDMASRLLVEELAAPVLL